MHNWSRPIALAGLAVTLGACSTKDAKDAKVRGTEASPAMTVPQSPAGHAPRGTLSDLHWIIGSFRGAGAQGMVQAPFFERYSLAGDSALVVETFTDSTFTGVSDSTRYVLRGDSLTNAESAATSVSPGSVTFTSRKVPGLAWTWRRDGEATWTAIIVNAIPNGPPKTRVYQMVPSKQARATPVRR